MIKSIKIKNRVVQLIEWSFFGKFIPIKFNDFQVTYLLIKEAKLYI
jgi:hypothetical protein